MVADLTTHTLRVGGIQGADYVSSIAIVEPLESHNPRVSPSNVTVNLRANSRSLITVSTSIYLFSQAFSCHLISYILEVF